jgi:putative DNA primase/helicase
MAVQILGLRPYVDRRGKERKAEKFFENEWRAPSVQHLFKNIDSIIDQIPEEERWNLYYTAAICKEEKGRIFETQSILPIDIDGIDVNRLEEYVTVVCNELELKRDEIGIVFTGNGLQFIIQLDEEIDDVGFFDSNRHLYKAMCGKINQALFAHGLEGNADTSVFSGARLLRMPNTENIKPNKPRRTAYIINDNICNTGFSLEDCTGLPKVLEGEHIHPRAFIRLPDPDPVGVQEQCEFIKYCYNNQANISEPQWYAMLSIIGRLPEGERLVHDYSKDHPQYSPEDTHFKYKQAIEASGPRKCENIDTLWDGCRDCSNYGKCTSPIMLRSESYIGTKDTGFYDVTINPKSGAETRRPNYDDLVKYFKSKHEYATMEIANIVHTYDGKKWMDISRNKIHNFSEVNFDPSPSNQMCMEFEHKLKRTQLRDQDWFQCDGYINFQNGVLHLDNNELLEHSSEFGFKYVLPFDYDPTADCPQFKQFLKDVTLDRTDIQKVLVEFMGYSLTGIDPQLGQKALILYGGGSNGKSVFIEILRALAGQDNYSTLSMGNEVNKLENRYQLQGKLFNVSEETPTNAMVDSSVFKALVAGGEVQARKLYCDPFSMRNYAKIIMACNELPKSSDMSHGMLRRLLIVPFNATFTKENRDIHIVNKLKEELSGIFNLAMVGYNRFISQSGFTDSHTVEEEVKNYVDENDTVQNFILDNCTVADSAIVPASKIYTAYSFYCDNGNMKPLNRIKFGKRLKQILQMKYRNDMTDRQMINGMRQRVYKGIGLMEQGGSY